jgi:hypothetical protein
MKLLLCATIVLLVIATCQAERTAASYKPVMDSMEETYKKNGFNDMVPCVQDCRGVAETGTAAEVSSCLGGCRNKFKQLHKQ